jgi:hypothetical protein
VAEQQQVGEGLGVLGLHGIVEGCLPVGQQHVHADEGQVEEDDDGKQPARLPLFLAVPVGPGQGPGIAQEGQESAHRGHAFR